MASGSTKVIAAYDVKLMPLIGKSNRTSFVIAPDGKIIAEYSALDYKDHVGKMMAAVKEWRAAHPG